MAGRTLRLSTAAGVTLVAAFVLGILAVRIFGAAHRPLSWAAAALVIAVLLDPAVDRLALRIRRAPAVLLCFLVVGGAVLGLAYLVFDDIDRAVGRLQEAAPDAAAQIEERDDGAGNLARDLRLEDRVTEAMTGLEDRFDGGGEVLRSTALTAPAYLVGAILTVFLLSHGPRIGTAAIQQLPANRRRRTREVLARSSNQARSAVLLTMVDMIVVGLIAGLAAFVLDLPAPAALGVLAGLVAVLPHLGIVLGSIPVILLALGLESAPLAGVVALGAIGLQAADSLIVRRRIDRFVQIGLLVPWVVVLLGYAVYGVGAGVYGLAIAIFAVAVLDELAADDSPSAGSEPGALTTPTS